MARCPKCDTQVSPTIDICPKCLKNLNKERQVNYDFFISCKGDAPEGQVWCPNCHKEIPADSRLCPNCLTQLDKYRQENKTFCELCGFDWPPTQTANANAIQEGVTITPAYCTSCGKPLAEGATFCGYCSAPVNKPSSEQFRVGAQQGSQTSPSAKQKMSTTGIAARVVSALVIVFMLMPWLSISTVRTMGQYASAYGLNGSSGQYSMLEMSNASDMLKAMWGSGPFESAQLIFFIVWIIALVLIAIGLVRSVVGDKRTGGIAGGGVACCLVAIIWCIAIPMLSKSYYGALEVTFACYASIVCSVLAVILSVTKN